MNRSEQMLRRWMDEPNPDNLAGYVGAQLGISDEEACMIMVVVVAASIEVENRREAAAMSFLTGLAFARFAQVLDDEELDR